MMDLRVLDETIEMNNRKKSIGPRLLFALKRAAGIFE